MQYFLSYRLAICDNSKELHHVGMSKLSHDRRFLQELHFLLWAATCFERLHCHRETSRLSLNWRRLWISLLIWPNFIRFYDKLFVKFTWHSTLRHICSKLFLAFRLVHSQEKHLRATNHCIWACSEWLAWTGRCSADIWKAVQFLAWSFSVLFVFFVVVVVFFAEQNFIIIWSSDVLKSCIELKRPAKIILVLR